FGNTGNDGAAEFDKRKPVTVTASGGNGSTNPPTTTQAPKPTTTVETPKPTSTCEATTVTRTVTVYARATNA
ncbi:hypothetical protein BGZ50_005373, partial [Haplosporangium sp. Z 11]